MAQEDRYPVLGQDPRRSRIAYASQIVVLALLLRHFQAQGHFEVLGTYLRVWNPLVKPCGHLHAKEFVILSDRILRPHGAFPGFGARAPLSVSLAPEHSHPARTLPSPTPRAHHPQCTCGAGASRA